MNERRFIVTDIRTPPWHIPSNPSKPRYGFTSDLEAQAFDRSEAQRLAYKAAHPMLYAKWEVEEAEDEAARRAIFDAPNIAAARAAAAEATNKLSHTLAERVNGADKMAVINARRLAKKAERAAAEAAEAARLALIPPM